MPLQYWRSCLAHNSNIDHRPAVCRSCQTNNAHPSINIFKLFFTAALVTIMVEQTNLYACQVLGEKAEADWTNVNESEIFAKWLYSWV